MLSWIDETTFDQAVQTLVQRAEDARAKAEERRVKNVVDPFWTLLVASTFEVQARTDLRSLQQFESALRGMSNALGEFHQIVLGSIDGWENHDKGYDLKCSEHKIIAEVKNKWNTLNAPGKKQTVNNLSTVIHNMRDSWTAYLVQIVPKTPIRYKTTFVNNVIETDGASFYHLATGYPNAIHDLFDELSERLAPSDDIAVYCKQIMDQSFPPRQ